MLAILQKFNSLPEDIKEKVSGSEAMKTIANLEKIYGVNLAKVVMRVMVRELPYESLREYFVFEYNFTKKKAENLVSDLENSIFSEVLEFIGVVKNESTIIESYKEKEIRRQEEERRENKNNLLENLANDNFSESEANIDSLSAKNNLITEDLEAVVEDVNTADNLPVEATGEEKVKNESVGNKTVIEDLKIDSDDVELHEVVLVEDESGLNDDIENKVNALIKVMNIRFSTEVIHNRFRLILRTYYKGVRNKAETRESLVKSIIDGGLGVDPNVADNIIKKVDLVNEKTSVVDELKNITSHEESKVETGLLSKTDGAKNTGNGAGVLPVNQVFAGKKEDKAVKKDFSVDNNSLMDALKGMSRDVEYDFSKLKKEPKKTVSFNVFADDISPIKTADTENVAEIEQKKAEDDKNSDSNSGENKENSISVRKIINDKNKISDVKQVPKIMGPVDELKEMNLISFRRLGETPRKCSLKIKGKVEVLEKDGYGQRLIGIKAWRKSPLNTMYIEVGNEAIARKIDVDAVIAERSGKGEDFLTKEEFRSIMDLNRELRF